MTDWRKERVQHRRTLDYFQLLTLFLDDVISDMNNAIRELNNSPTTEEYIRQRKKIESVLRFIKKQKEIYQEGFFKETLLSSRLNPNAIERYFSFIKECRNKNKRTKTEKQKHHIVPRSVMKLKDSENIVELTLTQHRIAHQLLAQAGHAGSYGAVQLLRIQEVSSGNFYPLDNKYVNGWYSYKE